MLQDRLDRVHAAQQEAEDEEQVLQQLRLACILPEEQQRETSALHHLSGLLISSPAPSITCRFAAQPRPILLTPCQPPANPLPTPCLSPACPWLICYPTPAHPLPNPCPFPACPLRICSPTPAHTLLTPCQPPSHFLLNPMLIPNHFLPFPCPLRADPLPIPKRIINQSAYCIMSLNQFPSLCLSICINLDCLSVADFGEMGLTI